jgi:hypothetical protein
VIRHGRHSRRLQVGEDTYLWSLGHTHHALGNGRYEDCCETLTLRRFRARGRLRIPFPAGEDRLVPDGFLMHSGAVGTDLGRTLNLHEPGTVRALLDAALTRGWQPDDPAAAEIDGWSLFDEVFAYREEASTLPLPQRP